MVCSRRPEASADRREGVTGWEHWALASTDASVQDLVKEEGGTATDVGAGGFGKTTCRR
jgi:hypothetical protein